MNYHKLEIAWESESKDERIEVSTGLDSGIWIARSFYDPETGWVTDELMEFDENQISALIEALSMFLDPPKLKFCGGTSVRELKEPIQ
jgi:hypothetical protein